MGEQCRGLVGSLTYILALGPCAMSYELMCTGAASAGLLSRAGQRCLCVPLFLLAKGCTMMQGTSRTVL